MTVIWECRENRGQCLSNILLVVPNTQVPIESPPIEWKAGGIKIQSMHLVRKSMRHFLGIRRMEKFFFKK